MSSARTRAVLTPLQSSHALRPAFIEDTGEQMDSQKQKEEFGWSAGSIGASATSGSPSTSPSTARSSVFILPGAHLPQQQQSRAFPLQDASRPREYSRPKNQTRQRIHSATGDPKSNSKEWFKVQRGHRILPTQLSEECVYGSNYDSPAADWYAMLRQAVQLAFEHPSFAYSPLRASRANSSTFTPPETPPKRVLDVACGPHAEWMIEAAQLPGWEETHFTGIDIAPCLIALESLPDHLKERMDYQRVNILKSPWNLADSSFDLVRLAFLSDLIPDHKWADIFEEANRVCSPDGLIEVIDCNASLNTQEHQPIFETRKDAANTYKREVNSGDLRSDYTPHSISCATVDKRYLSSYPLSAIPSALLLSSKIVQSSGIIKLDQRGGSSSTEDASSLTSGSLAASHIHFDDASRRCMAHVQARALRNNADAYYDAFWEGFEQPLSWADSDAHFTQFAAIACDAASVNQLLVTVFDWHCNFDLSTEEQITRASSLVNEELRAAKEARDSPQTFVSELEKRTREYETELSTVQHRLYGRSEETAPVFQILEAQSWCATPIKV